MSESVIIRIQKIKSPQILRDALKHNLRLIPQETSIKSHINPARSALNCVLRGGENPAEIAKNTVQLITTQTGKSLRANGIIALEVVFSLQIGTKIDITKFFTDSVQWLESYWNLPIISAVIHMDEANPHMQVIVVPVQNKRMLGAAVVGYKKELAAFKRNHHVCVAKHYGLTESISVPRFRRYATALKIVDHLLSHQHLISHPSIRDALIDVIAIKSSQLISVLGVDPEFSSDTKH